MNIAQQQSIANNTAFRVALHDLVNRTKHTERVRTPPQLSYLNECFEIIDSKLYWLPRPPSHFSCTRIQKSTNTQFAGKQAGCVNPKTGYRFVKINHRLYLTHKILYYMYHGVCPDEIDHKDRNRQNNSINNLRPATRSNNRANCKLYSCNKSGYKGVYFHQHTQKWCSSIQVRHIRKHLGLFDDVEAAGLAYKHAAETGFGPFANPASIVNGAN